MARDTPPLKLLCHSCLAATRMSVNGQANSINRYDSHASKRDAEAASKEQNVFWLCLMSCWAFFHHYFTRYFIRACCHLHICRRRADDVDGNEIDLELSTYPTEDPLDGEADSCISDDHMKRRLLRHFRSHISKWLDKDRPRFPWKATLHILLVALVTGQVSINNMPESYGTR